jgi:hypothetical protein
VYKGAEDCALARYAAKIPSVAAENNLRLISSSSESGPLQMTVLIDGIDAPARADRYTPGAQ